MSDTQCSHVYCEEPADGIYTNGVFNEPRCRGHAQADHVSKIAEVDP